MCRVAHAAYANQFLLVRHYAGDSVPCTPAKGCFTLWKPNFHIFLSQKGEKNMRSDSKNAAYLQKVQKTMFLE